MKEEADPFDPTSQLNQFVDDIKLESIIGDGSFAVVFAGRDLSGKEYALKCLYKTGLSKNQMKVQYEEVLLHQAASVVENVNKLIRVIDTPDHLYLVLEKCDGDLLTFLQAQPGNCISERDAKRMFNEIAGAVDKMHSLGIYHRDLKPENILLKDNHCYICDFGLATSDPISNEFGCGSFRYMSPECNGDFNYSEYCLYQPKAPRTKMLLDPEFIDFPFVKTQSTHISIPKVQGRPRTSTELPLPYLSALNDVWSLGVILVNLLTGKNPWNEPSLSDKHFRRYFFPQNKPRIDTFSKKFGFSLEFSSLLRKVFHLNPAERPSCKELIASVNSVRHIFTPGYKKEYGLLTPPEERGSFFGGHYTEKVEPKEEVNYDIDVSESLLFAMELEEK